MVLVIEVAGAAKVAGHHPSWIGTVPAQTEGRLIVAFIEVPAALLRSYLRTTLDKFRLLPTPR